jgi:hypothetical protein
LVSLVVFRVRALIGTDTPISHHHIISNTYEVGLGRRRIPHVLVGLRRKCKAVAMQHIIESLHRIILKVATLKLFSKKPDVDVQQISSRLDLTNNVFRSGLVVFRRLAFAIFVVLIYSHDTKLKELLVNAGENEFWSGSAGKTILKTEGIFEYR